MLLSPQDVELFFRPHWTLMFFVNQRLQVLPDALANSADVASASGSTWRRWFTKNISVQWGLKKSSTSCGLSSIGVYQSLLTCRRFRSASSQLAPEPVE